MFNDCTSPMQLLLTRRSARARDLVPPGPDPATLDRILAAAMRVPDHGKLAPWRFVIIDTREAFADRVLAGHAIDRPEAGKLERQALRDFAHQAPCLVAVISQLRESHIPAWEQELSAGAATAHLLLAAHAAGFAANWLTGPAAYLPNLADALGVADGRVAGFVFIGTPSRPLEERPRPAPADVVLRF
jgi:nitroreductase